MKESTRSWRTSGTSDHTAGCHRILGEEHADTQSPEQNRTDYIYYADGLRARASCSKRMLRYLKKTEEALNI